MLKKKNGFFRNSGAGTKEETQWEDYPLGGGFSLGPGLSWGPVETRLIRDTEGGYARAEQGLLLLS